MRLFRALQALEGAPNASRDGMADPEHAEEVEVASTAGSTTLCRAKELPATTLDELLDRTVSF